MNSRSCSSPDDPAGAPRELNLAAKEQAQSAQPRLASYDPAQDRETARFTIAKWLVALLAIVYLFVTIVAFAQDAFVGVTLADLTTTYVTPVVALVSFVLGFYFAEKS